MRVEEELDESAERIGSIFTAEAKSLNKSAKISSNILVIVGTILAAIFQLLRPTDAELGHWSTIAGLFAAGTALVGGLWGALGQVHSPQALDEARKALDLGRRAEREYKFLKDKLELERLTADQEIEDLILDSDWAKEMYVFAKQLIELIEQIQFRSNNFDNKTVQDILDFSFRQLSSLAYFDGGEYWTVSVYRPQLSDEIDLKSERALECIANLRADRSEEKSVHRAWKIGQGVAGHTFAAGAEIVVEDIKDRRKSHWLNVPTNMVKVDDSSKYRSLVGIPILIGRSSQEPWGVIVATSDVENGFVVEHDADDEMAPAAVRIEPLRLLAAMIAAAAAPSFKPD